MDLELDGKVVVISGGARGIGRTCSEGFAREGARIAILDWDKDGLLDAKEKIGATGAEVMTLHVDVSNSKSVDDAHAEVIATMGTIDIGFNNAGIITPSKAIEDTSEEDWDRVVGINLKGIWLCVRAQVRHMRPLGQGVIVNTASAAAFVGAPGTTPYTSAKHGIIGLTKSVALELAGTGVRVNAVAPGTVETEMNDILFDNEDQFADALVRQELPIGRAARPEEISDAVLWLSSARSSFALGSTLIIDGGFTAQ